MLVYNNIGNTLKDQGKLNEALDAYKQAVLLIPDTPEIHNNLGLTLKEQGKFDGPEGL